MKALEVAVCEDDDTERERMRSLLAQGSLSVNARFFSSGEALLAAYRPRMFDLLLVDIYLAGMTGLETIAKIREIDRDVPVAFVTTSLDHTLESYRLSALKYIEKPASPEAVREILELAQLKKQNAPSLRIRREGREERIPFADILFLEQRGRQCSVFLAGGESITVYEKLSALRSQLDDAAFFTPHKSFCVNLAFVRCIDRELKCFVMADGRNVPVRRESMGSAKKAYEDFLFYTVGRGG